MPEPRIWLVERYLGGPTDALLARLADETGDAVRALIARGVAIEYLGSTAIPGDDICFCLFASPTRAAVEEINGAVSAPAIRVVDALAARLPR